MYGTKTTKFSSPWIKKKLNIDRDGEFKLLKDTCTEIFCITLMVDFEWLQACMLAFYPEFEAAIDPSPEVIFLMDLSNSMKGDAFRDSRKVYLLSN